jgi:hypothetical protein
VLRGKRRAAYNWNGFYAGVNFGGAFDTEDVTNPAQVFSTDPTDALGGVQLRRLRHFNSDSLALASLNYA